MSAFVTVDIIVAAVTIAILALAARVFLRRRSCIIQLHTRYGRHSSRPLRAPRRLPRPGSEISVNLDGHASIDATIVDSYVDGKRYILSASNEAETMDTTIVSALIGGKWPARSPFAVRCA